MEAIICWIGGKARLAKEIASRISPHRTYVEPFGGAMWVLLEKRPSEIDVYNDINSDVVNLFMCIKSDSDRFLKEANYGLVSREIFEAFRNEIRDSQCDNIGSNFERAAQFFYIIKNSYSGKMRVFKTRYEVSARNSFESTKRRVSELSARMASITLEHLSFEKLIPKYDTTDTFFYLDPPYWVTLAQKDYYRHRFTLEQHATLAGILKNIKGKFLLSYDDVPEIREVYKWANIEEIENVYSVNCGKTIASGDIVGNEKKIELLISNYDYAKQLKLRELFGV